MPGGCDAGLEVDEGGDGEAVREGTACVDDVGGVRRVVGQAREEGTVDVAPLVEDASLGAVACTPVEDEDVVEGVAAGVVVGAVRPCPGMCLGEPAGYAARLLGAGGEDSLIAAVGMAVGRRADDVNDPVEVFLNDAGEGRGLGVVDDGADAAVFQAPALEGFDNSEFVGREGAADVTLEMAAIIDAFPAGIEFRWLKSHGAKIARRRMEL